MTVFGARPGRVNASARLLADGLGLVAGMVAGIVTARYLGPEGKGLFAVITYMVGIAALLATSGLGEAEIFFVNRGLHGHREAIQTALVAVTITGFAAGIVLVVVLRVYLPADVQWGPIILAGATVQASAVATTVAQLHNIRERFVLTSALAAAMSGLAALLLWLFLGHLSAGLTGALAATFLVPFIGVAAVWPLVRDNLGGRVRPEWRYFREGSRYGLSLVTAGALMALAGRADLLVVDVVSGSGSAGLYSVALTVAALPTYGASAVAFVAFPRLSRETQQNMVLTSRLGRLGLLLALVASLGLGPVMPTLIPALFGSAFSGAVRPTLILLAGAPLWALHLVLGRAAAAADRPTLLARSYLLTLVVMLVLDAFLIPSLGLSGAGIASALAPLSGLVLLLRWYHLGGGEFAALVPRSGDVHDLFRFRAAEKPRRTGG